MECLIAKLWRASRRSKASKPPSNSSALLSDLVFLLCHG